MKSVEIYACLFFVTSVAAKNIGDPCDQLKYESTMPSRSVKELNRPFSHYELLQSNLNDVIAYVDCGFRGLTEVPKTIPKSVQYLDLGRNMITRIRRDDFDLYRDLIILNLELNCISVDAKPLLLDTPFENMPTCQKMLVIEEGSFSHQTNSKNCISVLTICLKRQVICLHQLKLFALTAHLSLL